MKLADTYASGAYGRKSLGVQISPRPLLNNSKFKAEIETEKDKIEVKIEAEDISGLLAGVNSYLKLIRTSIEVQEVD